MRSNHQLAEDILHVCSTPGNRSEIVNAIENRISWQMDDVFKLIKNINETSIDRLDRAQRIIEMEAKYGIPKTHLIL